MGIPLTLCRARDYIIVPGAPNSHSSKNTHRISKIFIFLETLNNSESTSAVKKKKFSDKLIQFSAIFGRSLIGEIGYD